jgi:small acid-soluble spore protein H (minor)
MDVNRAKEIIESADIIKVTYEGESVWIDSVDATTKTATVHEQNGDTESITVPVNHLNEQ